MDRGLAVLVTAVAGGIIATQPPLNAGLGRAIGDLPGVALSFAVGTIALTVLAAAFGGGFGQVERVRDLEWYYVIGGGLAGAVYVTTVLITVRSLGAGGAVAATVAGQLTISVLLDRLGVLGLEEQPITVAKVAGVALLAAGTWLIVR